MCVRAAALLLALPLLASAADLRRIESVGVVALDRGRDRTHAPRDGAVRAAVARGVEGIAEELLPEGWQEQAPAVADKPSATHDLDPVLATALGPDPFEYATRFRILEDRGVRAALFTQDPDVESEYVVVVEVFVDVGRVRERLVGVGWIDATAAPGARSQVRLVVEGLESYAAYAALRRTLLDELEVRAALPVEFTPGRAVIDVDGPYGAESLLQALIAESGEGLRVVPLERDAQTLTLLVDWSPPASPAAAAADEGLDEPRLED